MLCQDFRRRNFCRRNNNHPASINAGNFLVAATRQTLRFAAPIIRKGEVGVSNLLGIELLSHCVLNRKVPVALRGEGRGEGATL
jgi:hypothetical protein